MLANILKQLGINDTLWIQLGIFTVLFLLLRFFFFVPFLRLIELREKETSGAEKDAAELLKKAEANEAEYGAKLSAVKKQARDNSESILARAKTDAAQRVNTARAGTKEKIETGRAKIMTEAKGALESARSQSERIAGMIVAKLMNTKVDL